VALVTRELQHEMGRRAESIQTQLPTGNQVRHPIRAVSNDASAE